MPDCPFHLAFPVQELRATRAFYEDVLDCTVGRSAATWIDFDFFGHQITAHLSPSADRVGINPVDGDAVPVRHFGVVLPWATWHQRQDALRAAGVPFLVEPKIRFVGEVGEQATMFIQDPSGNAIELKAFRDPKRLFARDD